MFSLFSSVPFACWHSNSRYSFGFPATVCDIILLIKLRRTYKEDSPLLVLDGCTIDFSRAEVHKGSDIISLTAKEHTLLETLARNAGKIVTVDALCEALWGDNPFGYENSLNAHVRRVREKIETDPSKPVSLITIKGLGYKLIARK